ncbi:hypothetical protein QTO34_011439 [Cnephaeus nilssonii]|uniref:Uncharacterized protein n=1 Tax=Cnephaeus nilssonii TaxID=3371016 RepID=A0AA40HDI8_CNENI|nr:hypothetical protein QTO34_011439 [Eptesicus nilssonii]
MKPSKEEMTLMGRQTAGRRVRVQKQWETSSFTKNVERGRRQQWVRLRVAHGLAVHARLRGAAAASTLSLGFMLPPLGGGLGAGAGAGRGSERTPCTAGSRPQGPRLPSQPGSFAECVPKCQELFPIQMEGVKLTGNKGLSNHFPVNHTVALSTIGESNYHFGVTYVGTKQLSPTEAFPVLVGDMDNSGSLNAQVIHSPAGSRSGPRWPPRPSSQKFVHWQVDEEYRGSDFTAAERRPPRSPLTSKASRIPPGGCFCHRRPGEEGTVKSPAGKYMLNWLATVTLGQAGMHHILPHTTTKPVTAADQHKDARHESLLQVPAGFAQGQPLFKGSVDSNRIMGATRRRSSCPCPCAPDAGPRAFLNHLKDQFQCGFGLTIG